MQSAQETGLKENERRAICGICSAGCWVIVSYDRLGRIKGVRADETSNLGQICRTGEQSPQIVYSRDRLLYPLKRRGRKGTFSFDRISWDEAYSTITSALHRIKDESGPEATAIYTGSGSFELAFCDMFQPAGVAVSSAASVLFPFGSPNTLGVGALCYVSFAMIAPHVTMGGMFIDMFSDIENAELIVIWGKNPAAHCPPDDFIRINKAHAAGAQIVVIDPRKTIMAKYEHAEWIPIRPGTDGALALAMANVLIAEELYDADFVENWTRGFEEFARYVQHFRPEAAEDITGIPAETIRTLARRLAAARGAAPVMYSGLEYSDGAVQAIRAAMVLWALAGQLDVPGGHCFKMAANTFPVNREGLIANPDVEKAAGYNKFPLYTRYRGEFHASILPEAVLKGSPYPIRLLISLGSSIITSWPQSPIWRDTLGALDFFVCIDRQLTADAAYADIVLPAATYYEIESYMRYGPLFRIREKVIEPVGEARSDFFILAELARRLGYGNLYPQTEDELLKRALHGSGFSLDDVRANDGTVQLPVVLTEYRKWKKGLLRKDGQPGFDTPSGKFEIASSVLEDNGYDALPVYTEPGESPLSRPDLARTFPLVFNSGARARNDLHALHLSTPSLSREKPVPTVMINSNDAAGRAIADGDLVSIRTPRGNIDMYAMVTDDIVPGAIEASGMGGGPLGSKAWRAACVNDLTDLGRFDPISGFPVYKALLCDVEKAGKGRRQKMTGKGEHEVLKRQTGPTTPNRVYLDNNATSPVAREVKEAIGQCLDSFGNPSSIHREGREARSAMESARRRVALLIHCTARRIIFTSGGSEANNLAIKGVAFGCGTSRNHLMASSVEHDSVLNTFAWLAQKGFTVTYLPVDRKGRVDPEYVREALTDKTALVSVMLANNETGTIQPIRELSGIVHDSGALFHCDAVQAAGRIPVDVEDLGVDLLTLSAHKFRGPKGVGALYVRNGTALSALVHGGKQEQGKRAGTENLAGIVGMGKAAELAIDGLTKIESVRSLRNRLEAGIREIIPEAKRNGDEIYCLPNTLNITLPGIRGEALLIALDQQGVAISSGSACRAGTPEASHALLAMGLSEEEAHCAVRFSLGKETSTEDIEYTLSAMKLIFQNFENSVRFVSCR
ncbi:MAG: IscS subfamily cysteine desulfurase [Syntrophorhabdaceae bacterium]